MAARIGMANLITRLRGMTQAGTADYTVAGTAWWNDDQMEDVLDAYRVDMNHVQLRSEPERNGGTLLYRDYYAPSGNLEEAASGAEAWEVEDSRGDDAGTANYTADYIRGLVRFSVDQGGTIYYLRARSYNLPAAAAQMWREKAGWRAQHITFKADDQTFEQSEWFEHCMTMAEYYERHAGGQHHRLSRSDLL